MASPFPPGESHEYAEIPMQASISSSKHASPEELEKMAKAIWRKVADSGIDRADEAKNDELLGRLQNEYKDFNASFPIVLRWMVQAREFKAKAFRKYLLKHATAKLDTREAFLELQAEYLIYLYREGHRHANEAHIREYRASLVKQLLDEDKEFVEMQKSVEEDLAARDVEIGAERRKQLYEYLLRQRADAAQLAARS